MASTAPKQRRRVRLLPAIVAAAAFAAIATSDQTIHDARRGSSAARRGQAATYFIDPATGLQREPTPEELLELQQPSLQAADPPQAITSDQGFAGLRLTDDQMTFTVATKNRDGSVSVSHAAGKKDAERQVKQLTERGVVAGKEQRLER